MDFLQKSSEERWIRVFYVPDNFVTCICVTGKREKEAGSRWSNFELYGQHVLICCTKKPQQRYQKEETKMWRKMSAENASRSTFWLHSKTKFLTYWAPDEIFGKCINDMPMYLNLPNCFLTFLKSASLDLELCFQTSKSPQIWMGHFLLRNTYQPVTRWQFALAVTQNQDSSFSSVQGPWRASTAFILLFLKGNL